MSFQLDQRYIDSTDKEKIFLDEYALTKNITDATQKAYDVIGDREKIRRYGLTVMKRERIAGLIRDYIAVSPEKILPSRDELRHHYMDIFHNSASTMREKLQALTAYERVSGFTKTAPKSTDQDHDPLDDITG